MSALLKSSFKKRSLAARRVIVESPRTPFRPLNYAQRPLALGVNIHASFFFAIAADCRAETPPTFSNSANCVFIIHADARRGPLKSMAARQQKITIEVCGSASDSNANEGSLHVTNDAVLHLARLIGRQIANEQFERQFTKERRDDRKRARN